MYRAKIESLAYGGYGVARIDGKACFVPYGVPGDDILMDITSHSRGVSWGNIIEIYSPSPFRREPPCALFGRCGGCQWLHIDERTQIEWKRKIVESSFQRIGKFEHGEIQVIQDGIKTLDYRTRAQFHFEFDDGLKFGFHETRSHGIVDLDSCPLLFSRLNNLIPKIKASLDKIEPLKFMASFRLICNPSSDDTLGWLDLAGKDERRYDEIVPWLSETDGLSAIDWPENSASSLTFKLKLPGATAQVPAGAFSQASFFNNEMLIDLIMNLAGDVHGKKVIDIYCGWGNLSLPLASKGASIWGCDNDPQAIASANSSVSDNQLGNCMYDIFSDLKLAEKLGDSRDKFDIAILDPPRTGAKPIAKALAESSIGKIIYVSCDPNTLARDLKLMLDSGRKLEKVFIIDMIPQTYHIECVACLK